MLVLREPGRPVCHWLTWALTAVLSPSREQDLQTVSRGTPEHMACIDALSVEGSGAAEAAPQEWRSVVVLGFRF